MPIKVQAALPAVKTLSNEGIFVMTDERAEHQDIRPLKIAILNLMPTKIETETQLLRLIGNSPLQVEVLLLRPKNHVSKNTSPLHLDTFYATFDSIRNSKLDGLIITGAPVENLSFEEVDYWEELTEIMDWSKKNVFSTFHICWAAQAGLYHHYGIEKYELPEKMFGVFEHTVVDGSTQLTRGFDDVFFAPHSRHTGIHREDVLAHPKLNIICDSHEAGVYIISAKNGRQIFVTGHSEYDPLTLKREYDRDVAKGLEIKIPKNYFQGDDPHQQPLVRWRGHANLLYCNWLNYYVYQETPYDMAQIREHEDLDCASIEKG